MTFNDFLKNNFRYEERIDRVETRITARLRDQLGTVKNAAEILSHFFCQIKVCSSRIQPFNEFSFK